jgi:hypothetical protein
MTRDEAIADIRAVERRCKGPLRQSITPRDYERFSKELQDTLAAVSTAVPAEDRATTSQLKAVLLAKDEWKPSARELDAAMRTGCGWNFNEVIEAGPFDGTSHVATCPKCGQGIAYRLPIHEIEPEAAPAS